MYGFSIHYVFCYIPQMTLNDFRVIVGQQDVTVRHF